ncbi:hypothetical protein SUGI_1059410 [Cryptomeria japonica]|nr:hypothetical protein SUGI_1059410 [Cryptomeria japonica]
MRPVVLPTTPGTALAMHCIRGSDQRAYWINLRPFLDPFREKLVLPFHQSSNAAALQIMKSVDENSVGSAKTTAIAEEEMVNWLCSVLYGWGKPLQNVDFVFRGFHFLVGQLTHAWCRKRSALI